MSDALPAAADFARQGMLRSPEATGALACRCAARLQGAEVLLLWGPLGAGKTFFVQALCRALGVPDEVTSPSFTLANRYRGRLVVHHLDLFRVTPEADLMDIGVEEVLDEVATGDAILVVEWPALLVPHLRERLELMLLPGRHAQARSCHLRGVPSLPAAWLDLLEAGEPEC